MFGISEIAILIIVAVVVLGAKKLPGLARSAGRSARILKSEAKAMRSERTSGRPAPEPRVIRADDGGAAPSRPGTASGPDTPR
ncbi:twin-arginine translocase TatA/TatE family subunit [Streptomyces radiopugnans]|uniref:twin-arginine translocase TatA/TatE family subunit n=1 Tax=Streptomyces radiopugnans TaxID=403935 RepID=UPI003F19498C